MAPREGNSSSYRSRSSSRKRSTREKSAQLSSKSKAPTSVLPTHVVVDSKTYDAEKLLDMHPGGEMFIRAFAGRDASNAFLSYHRKRFPHDQMKKYLAFNGAVSNKVTTGNEDYLELCDRVHKVLPRSESFAPWHYFVKCVGILGSAVALEVYMHTQRKYCWYLCGTLGFLMALIGLNIQHDANHGAVSRSAAVNRLLGLTQNWIGGSAIDWVHQHVVQHHVSCGDVHHDPDIMGGFLLRLNPRKESKPHHAWQYAYVFVLLAGFGISTVLQSLLRLVKGVHLKKMSDMVVGYRVLESLTWMCFMLRWLVLPIYLTGSLRVLLPISAMYVVAGYYLSFFFIISHNFDGVESFDADAGQDARGSFLYRQIASSSNVGGSFLCFLNGGLNYQIEHHLFPRISHCHYPLIAPVVRQYCTEKGVPYVHFRSISDNVSSLTRHLTAMGTGYRGTIKESSKD